MTLLPMIQRRHFLLLAGGAALAACADKGETLPTFAPIRFKSMPAFRLNVEKVEIENRYRAPGVLPNVDHAMQNQPAAVAAAWAQDRLEAGGQPGGAIARFVILDAHVVETELAKTPGLKGTFTRDQAFKYDAHLRVEFSVRDEQGMTAGTASADVTAMRTLKEDATETERLTLWNEIAETLGREMNAQLEKGIPQAVNRYLMF